MISRENFITYFTRCKDRVEVRSVGCVRARVRARVCLHVRARIGPGRRCRRIVACQWRILLLPAWVCVMQAMNVLQYMELRLDTGGGGFSSDDDNDDDDDVHEWLAAAL